MKKIILLLYILSSLVAVPTVAFANDEKADRIDELIRNIQFLETELESKKSELNRLTYEDKNETIKWVDVGFDGGSEKYINKIIKMGIDYSTEVPELHTIHYVKNTSGEQYSPRGMVVGKTMVVTDEFTDWGESHYHTYHMEKDGENYIESNVSLPSKVADGWEGYFKTIHYLDEPNGKYYYIDSFLGGYRFKIAISGTDEPIGTLLEPGT